MDLIEKEAKLFALLRELGSVLVAFSAGVDSTYLLAAAVKALGPEYVRAVTSEGPSLPLREREEAGQLARGLGASHEFVPTTEFSSEAFLKNGPDRCYHCKDALFRALLPIAQKHQLNVIVYGATTDDLGDYRPGMRAAAQHEARAPLLEAGLSKAEIRILSERSGLKTHDKPAMACLSSRIPYGNEITPAKLRQVETAEDYIRNELGIRQVRVRHHGVVARIEIDVKDMSSLLESNKREELVRQLKAIGFTFVTLDLSGFKSGSLNEVLHGPV